MQYQTVCLEKGISDCSECKESKTCKNLEELEKVRSGALAVGMLLKTAGIAKSN